MKLIKVAFVCSIVFAITSCDWTPSKQNKNNRSIVGVVAPLTGEGASYGASMRRGIELAFKNDDTVQLVFEDSKLSSKDGVTAIKKLITFDKSNVLYGAAASGVSSAIAPIAAEHQVVLLSSISTSDTLTNINPYFYRNVPRNALQGLSAAQYLKEKGYISKVAIFGENDEYGVNLSSSFKEALQNEDIEIVYEGSYLSTETDFRSYLSKIKDSSADAVFVPGNYEETGIILRQAKEIGLNALFIGGDGSYSPTLIEYAGEAAENFVCTIMGIDKSTPKYTQFEQAFEEEYSQAPDVYDTYAYEAGLILKAALKSDSIKGYLDSTNFETFSGPIKFEGSDMVRPYAMAEIKNGKFVDAE